MYPPLPPTSAQSAQAHTVTPSAAATTSTSAATQIPTADNVTSATTTSLRAPGSSAIAIVRPPTPPPRPVTPEQPECAICLEKPSSAYGLLQNCSHPFCLVCIRGWRNPELLNADGSAGGGSSGGAAGPGASGSNLRPRRGRVFTQDELRAARAARRMGDHEPMQELEARIRQSIESRELRESGASKSCPLCRVRSHFIIPSSVFWPEGDQKTLILNNYREALSRKPCSYFQNSVEIGRDPACPFGDDCFYKHELAPGEGRYVFNLTSEDMRTVNRIRYEHRLWESLYSARAGSRRFSDDQTSDDEDDYFRDRWADPIGFDLYGGDSEEEEDADDDDDEEAEGTYEDGEAMAQEASDRRQGGVTASDLADRLTSLSFEFESAGLPSRMEMSLYDAALDAADRYQYANGDRHGSRAARRTRGSNTQPAGTARSGTSAPGSTSAPGNATTEESEHGMTMTQIEQSVRDAEQFFRETEARIRTLEQLHTARWDVNHPEATMPPASVPSNGATSGAAAARNGGRSSAAAPGSSAARSSRNAAPSTRANAARGQAANVPPPRDRFWTADGVEVDDPWDSDYDGQILFDAPPLGPLATILLNNRRTWSDEEGDEDDDAEVDFWGYHEDLGDDFVHPHGSGEDRNADWAQPTSTSGASDRTRNQRRNQTRRAKRRRREQEAGGNNGGPGPGGSSGPSAGPSRTRI
ncbi:hypothetical protein OC845_001113 [Tilletia horrida]|nr:hypothetical protein OC845_001113 [Tilletia horrida]